MNRLRKRIRIGKYAVPILLLLILGIGTATAAIYVVLTWSMSLTVVANPRVSFYKWATEEKVNTFAESFNIFPDVKTIQDNATHGIYSLTAGTGSMRIVSDIATDPDIDEVYIKVFNTTDTILEITYSSNTNDFVSLPTAEDHKYTIHIEVTGASGATTDNTPSVDLEIKVESP